MNSGTRKRLDQGALSIVFEMLHKGATDRTIAAVVGCSPSSVNHHRTRLKIKVRRPQPRGALILCVREGCDELPIEGFHTCAAHRSIAPPVREGAFIKAPTLKQLMGAR